jgi:hypothetical protein
MTVDPFEVLGVSRSASVEEVRAARRLLARAAHPDHGGTAQRMTEINVAFDAVIGHLTRRRPIEGEAAPERYQSAAPGRPATRGLQRDEPSFTMDALPAEAFEALLMAAAILGDVLVDDPPYLLEALVREPAPCWCRLTLVPDAGGSTVTLVVAAYEDATAPDVEDVRDVWVTTLNGLY